MTRFRGTTPRRTDLTKTYDVFCLNDFRVTAINGAPMRRWRRNEKEVGQKRRTEQTDVIGRARQWERARLPPSLRYTITVACRSLSLSEGEAHISVVRLKEGHFCEPYNSSLTPDHSSLTAPKLPSLA